MKKHLLLLAIILGVNFSASAQLANGTIAPDFTLTDRDGVEHHLYQYLNEGKVVFIKFFACHCPGCWSYHNTNTLEDLHQAYGPGGTDQIVVIMLEHDQNNTDAFTGGGTLTQGDWTLGNTVPMIDVEGTEDRTVFDDYNLNYYPMVMKVCSDKTVELMSTSYSTQTLFDEANDCAGNLSVVETKTEGSLYLDQINKQVKLTGFTTVTNISIFNLAGQETLKLTGDSNNTVDVSALSPGMYIVKVENADGAVSKKIVIE
ncbi:MAG: thiol-disulfide isomerase/thioredoxin [Arenicella sp.]|jgi:thiol-disulfide isomerase/thioredoxin